MSETVVRSCTHELAQFASDLSLNDVPSDVRERATRHVLDTMGVALAGSSDPVVRSMAESLAAVDTSRTCTVMGTDLRLSAANAALINAMMAHTHDFDDTHLASETHPSAVVVSAAAAMAEWTHADGAALLSAVIAGYEIMCRIGLATEPGQIITRGYHPTCLLGPFGAAAVASKLLELSADQTAHALGVAASMAGGLLQFSDGYETKNEIKRFHPGWAAHSGISAAIAASAGLRAPSRVLEGKFGLFATHFGAPASRLELVTQSLGEEWATRNLCPKTYPCCQDNQAYMDVALTMKRRHKLALSDIVSVECHVSPVTALLECEPLDQKRRPQTAYAGMFSLPFCVALILSRDHATVADFTSDAYADPAMLSFMDRIGYSIDTEWSDYPAHYSGWISATLTDGQQIEERLRFNRGSKENPLPADDYRAKFMDNVVPVLGASTAAKLWELGVGLPQLDSAETMIGRLSCPVGGPVVP